MLSATPTALVFEFIDASGNVVSSQPLSVPVIADGQSQPLKLEGKGTGIVSWRYRKG